MASDLLQSLVVLDTETAFSGGTPHLVELAALRIVEGEAVDTFQSLVRADVPIDEASQAVHGLATEDLAGAPACGEVLAAFGAWLRGETGWAHGARADARVLAFEHARHGLELPGLALVDGISVSRRLLPELPHHDLQTLVEHLDLERDPPHRALPDAAAAWQVAERCLDRLGGWGRVTRSGLLAAGTLVPLASESPRPPRRHRAHARRIEEARRRGARVELLYAAEGAPPARLVVRPRLLYQHGEKAYLEAECLASGVWKTYRLDRVQRALPLEAGDPVA